MSVSSHFGPDLLCQRETHSLRKNLLKKVLAIFGKIYCKLKKMVVPLNSSAEIHNLKVTPLLRFRCKYMVFSQMKD